MDVLSFLEISESDFNFFSIVHRNVPPRSLVYLAISHWC